MSVIDAEDREWLRGILYDKGDAKCVEGEPEVCMTVSSALGAMEFATATLRNKLHAMTESEHAISAAYVRLRLMIPGAAAVPSEILRGPPEKLWKWVEERLEEWPIEIIDNERRKIAKGLRLFAPDIAQALIDRWMNIVSSVDDVIGMMRHP